MPADWQVLPGDQPRAWGHDFRDAKQVDVLKLDLSLRIKGELPSPVTVKISGIRAGRDAIRFTRYTEEQMLKNNSFWD